MSACLCNARRQAKGGKMVRDIKDGMVTMEWYGATVVYPIEEVEDDEAEEAS